MDRTGGGVSSTGQGYPLDRTGGIPHPQQDRSSTTQDGVPPKRGQETLRAGQDYPCPPKQYRVPLPERTGVGLPTQEDFLCSRRNSRMLICFFILRTPSVFPQRYNTMNLNFRKIQFFKKKLQNASTFLTGELPALAHKRYN